MTQPSFCLAPLFPPAKTRTRAYGYLFGTIILMLGLLAPSSHAQDVESVTLEPAADNTLLEHPAGGLSNGAGEYLFAGRTLEDTNSLRRALLRFDLATIPAGATIDSVLLRMNLSKTISDAHALSLHRVLRAWGEGPSDALGQEGKGALAQTDDATWLHTFYNTASWDSAGGDFLATPSATLSVGRTIGGYAWPSTDLLTADVQTWLDDPASNHGWILIGDEAVAGSAKRFDSREHASAARRPQLTVYYTRTATAAEAQQPEQQFELLGVYPNPFRTHATVSFVLDQPAAVSFDLFDLLGRRVYSQTARAYPAGPHRFAIVPRALLPGLYLFRLDAGPSTHRGSLLHQP